MKVYRKIRKKEAKMGKLEDIYVSNDSMWRVYAKDKEAEYIFETEDQDEAIALYDQLLSEAE